MMTTNELAARIKELHTVVHVLTPKQFIAKNRALYKGAKGMTAAQLKQVAKRVSKTLDLDADGYLVIAEMVMSWGGQSFDMTKGYYPSNGFPSWSRSEVN